MTGPHQGKELELMLAGEKNLAIFYEALIEGQEIPEEIIPEKTFAPYVEKNIVTRFSRDFISAKSPIPIHFVCFTTCGNEWRAEAFFWTKEQCFSGKRPFDDAYEFFVGRLLDYTEEDILHYLDHSKQRREEMSRRSGT